MLERNKLIIAIAILFIIGIQTANAASTLPERKIVEKITVDNINDKDLYEETDIIKKVGLRDKFKRSPESQIISFFKKYNKYAMKNEFEKLRDLYTDDYMNNDGFDKESVFEMMKKSSDSYQNVTYETEIESINVTGNYAKVKIREYAKGETTNTLQAMNDNGIVESETEYTDYLKKVNNEWKIWSSDIESEYVSLLYGDAKYLTVGFTAPDKVPEGSEYEVAIKTVLPSETFAAGSIVNEEIVYPQKNQKDVFRTIKSDELARILKANTRNRNEYATVTLGITRARLEPGQLVIDMTGMAFFMKRVNVISKNSKKNRGET